MTDSWWLKVKRAQKHMIDIYREARRYAGSQPYEFTRLRRPNRQRQVAYRVRITEQPDPMLAVMLGDFVHNLRTALDHVIVACVPRQRQKSASFPILYEDIWARDKNGNFVLDNPLFVVVFARYGREMGEGRLGDVLSDSQRDSMSEQIDALQKQIDDAQAKGDNTKANDIYQKKMALIGKRDGDQSIVGAENRAA